MPLNMPENAWINCFDYARLLNMPGFSYNSIIIVTNVIMLKSLSTQFIQPGTSLPFFYFLKLILNFTKWIYPLATFCCKKKFLNEPTM